MHTETEDKMQIIKESLDRFVTTYVPNADLGAVDDVIVSYVIAAIDAVDSNPEEFYLHVNELMEIVGAYVTEFSKIDRDQVYMWMENVMLALAEKKQSPFMDEAAKPDGAGAKKEILSFQIPEPASKTSSNSSSRSNSTSEDDFKFPASSVRKMTRKQILDFESAVEASKKHAASLPPTSGPYEYTALIDFLTEMFPDVSPIEIKHCVTIALGDIEGALATLFHRRENGLSMSAGSLPARNRHVAVDSAAVKSRIIARYSYVDRESESKEHKPLAPKHAPKKMVRYRDNKIVSLKGERYTEVSKGDEEGAKKSNKKHHP